MHFGIATINLQGNEIRITNHRHTDNFSLDKLGNKELADAIRRDIKELYSIDYHTRIYIPNNNAEPKLFFKFDLMGLIFSFGNINFLGINKRMIGAFRRRKRTHIPLPEENNITEADYFKDDKLTEAMFSHVRTGRFINHINKMFRNELKIHNGNANKVMFDSADDLNELYNNRPELSDVRGGLKLAVNDTWGFKVWLNKYAYNHGNKKYSTEMKIRIIDHFGLDYGDINRFGLASNIEAEFNGLNNDDFF
jgi:hypothetical protein